MDGVDLVGDEVSSSFKCLIDVVLSLGKIRFNSGLGVVETTIYFILTAFGILFELMKFLEDI